MFNAFGRSCEKFYGASGQGESLHCGKQTVECECGPQICGKNSRATIWTSIQDEAATHAFQYALSTLAGIECVAHVVQVLTSFHLRTTMFSIDGVGAYDTISRRAMMQGFVDMAFYGIPFSFLWENDVGETQTMF